MIRENAILERAVRVLQQRLPPGWTARVSRLDGQMEGIDIDGLVTITAPDGRSAELVAEAKQRIDPRRAQTLVSQLKVGSGERGMLAVAPWMSDTSEEILAAAGANLVDLTGRVRIVLSEPGLYVETAGAERDPWPEDSRVTLRGDKAARVVLALCAADLPVGIRELAEWAGTSPGYVSKLVRMLDEQAAVSRTEAGQVGEVDMRRLLSRWAEDAPLERRTSSSTWIAPRGLSDLQGRLGGTDVRYAITGSLAASRRAPVTVPRVASIYVEDPEAFAEAMGLRPAEAGANVLLLTPDAPDLYDDTWTDDGLYFASLPRVVADLLTGPGRGPAEADALLDWMMENPGVWRG